MVNYLWISMLTLLSVVFYPVTAFAYQCVHGEAYFKDFVYQHYVHSDLVATLKPYKIEHYEMESEYESYNLIHARVLNSWKTNLDDSVILKDTNSIISGYISFEIDENYIIYAAGPSEDGFYETDTCAVEVLGDITSSQIEILDKIKLGKISIGKYYQVVERFKSLISSHLIDEIKSTATNSVVTVSILFDENTEDWSVNSVIEIIKNEARSSGISDLGKFTIKKIDSKTNLLWEHPKD